jgi:ApbE superfamily uncharacterized protein (UPF0280 family)
MNIFANTFSTLGVKTVLNRLNCREDFVKVDPGDRDLYRGRLAASDLIRRRVVVKETDLMVLSGADIIDLVREIVLTERDRLERYMAAHPDFGPAMRPVAVPDTAPAIVRRMAEAGAAAGVGPMAAVAGAVCEAVAEGVRDVAGDLLLENGGDLYLSSARERLVGIYAGEEPRLALRVAPGRTPIGICTSSGRIGHSLSLGDSAAATVIARSCALADAAATAVGNRVRGRHGVRAGLAAARGIPGVLGVVVIRDGELGAWGEVELVGLGEG